MSSIVDDVVLQLNQMQLHFTLKPILVGGKAMEYYELRKAGADIDLIISNEDYLSLAQQYPQERKDLYGDLGVILWPFEIWRSIALLDYDFYRVDSVECDSINVVSFERLMFIRVIAREVKKYNTDLASMVNYIYENQRNKEYQKNAEEHTASYQKHNGVIISGCYD